MDTEQWSRWWSTHLRENGYAEIPDDPLHGWWRLSGHGREGVWMDGPTAERAQQHHETAMRAALDETSALNEIRDPTNEDERDRQAAEARVEHHQIVSIAAGAYAEDPRGLQPSPGHLAAGGRFDAFEGFVLEEHDVRGREGEDETHGVVTLRVRGGMHGWQNIAPPGMVHDLQVEIRGVLVFRGDAVVFYMNDGQVRLRRVGLP